MALTDGLRILVRLALCRRTGVLAVVGELVSKAMRGNSVRVDYRGTTTSDHCPDAALSVQHGQLEGGASRTIELLDIGFIFCQVTTERSGPNL